MRDRITVKEAYRAMFCFLEEYFDRTKTEEIAALLGGLNLAEDGKPMDPAMWDDWLSAVERVTARPGGRGK
jgi:hypothetical protein